MNISSLAAATALAGILAVWPTGGARARTIVVDTGPSAENFTLYGQGAISPGIGSFRIGQGDGVYNSGTNISTFTLSGTITGGTAGFDAGTYALVTTYSGTDTPEAGPNAPFAQSNPSNLNAFFDDSLDPSTTMTLYLFGSPTGDHTIPLVSAGVFDGPSFGFGFTSATCTGVAVCGQNNVGLTPGAAIFGPVDISASFTVPEPATWAMMLIGFGGLGAAMRAHRRSAAQAD